MSKKIKNILLSTAYLPPIEYFSYIVNANKVFIEVYESYPKQTYRNRCNIYAPNGLLSLTIPVIRINGNHTKTKDIEISNHTNWRLQHWRSLQTAYNASAFFMYYKDELWEKMKFESNNLIKYNSHLLDFLMNEIGIKTSIELTKQYKILETEVDLRNEISPKAKKQLVKTTEYYQIYKNKHGYIPNLSILDLLFSEGPNTLNYIQSLKVD